MRHTTLFLGLVVLGSAMATSGMVQPAQAEEARRAGGDEALRRAQALMRELAQDKDTLAAELARVNSELSAAQQRETAAAARFDTLRARAGDIQQQYGQQQNDLIARLQQADQRLHSAQVDQQKMQQKMQSAEERIDLLGRAIQEREAWITTCSARNDDLYRANSELLARWRDKSVWDALTHAEPVTGLARARTEADAEQFQYRLDHLHLPAAPKFTTDGSASHDSTP